MLQPRYDKFFFHKQDSSIGDIPPNCFIVTQEWLTECFEKHSKVDEKPFVVQKEIKPVTQPVTPVSNRTVNTSMIDSSPVPVMVATTPTAPTNEREFLKGLVFYVTQYPEQVAKGVKDNIRYCGGKVVDSYSKECTHVLSWHMEFAEVDQVRANTLQFIKLGQI